jgi:hypothetical protein
VNSVMDCQIPLNSSEKLKEALNPASRHENVLGGMKV